jgi:hypothetical protein
MAQVRTWVGLDVHAAKVVAAIADSQSGGIDTLSTLGLCAVAVARELTRFSWAVATAD